VAGAGAAHSGPAGAGRAHLRAPPPLSGERVGRRGGNR
jgi:hypothetical protein